MEKYTVVQLKEIIKNHNKTNCPAISRKRKNELLEIIKILNIELPVKKIEKEKKPKKIKDKKLPPLLINNVTEGSYSDLRFKYRNHPAQQIHEALEDLQKGDYEDEKKAKKDIIYLKNLVRSDRIYDVYNQIKYKGLPLYEWNRKGKFNRITNRME